MSAASDSKATFLARCVEIGFSTEEVKALSAKPWCPLAGFAFAANYQPGGTDEGPLRSLAASFVEKDDLDDRMPAVRCLFYEAFTLPAADLKRKLDAKDLDEPRKMAMPERRQRMKEQRQRLGTSLKIEAQLEPSYASVDLFADMEQKDFVAYRAWSKFATREQ